MTAGQFRDIALGLDGVVEKAHMGHPDFRAAGRVFASLDAAERRGTVKLSPEEQRELVRGAPGAFAPASGAWGRQGWTTIDLSAADPPTVRGAILLAWQQMVNAPRTKAARRTRR